MPGQTRDAAASRAAILAAARLGFSSQGFERTTVRSVAASAGVDPALVMHYFGSKERLFAAAAELTIDLPDLTGVPPDRIADALVPVFLGVWGGDSPFMALLRAVGSNRAAADALLDVFAHQVAPALARAAVDHPQERAALVGAQVIGIAVTRYLLGSPPMAALGEPELVAWLRPVLAHYLTGEYPI